MKINFSKKIYCLLFLGFSLFSNAQIITPIAEDYKVISIGWNNVGDYTRTLILLHEMYDGTSTIGMNNAIGTITAFRGNTAAYNRINVVQINSSSAYAGTSASLQSFDNNTNWTLKTCIYNGKKYLALDVPYADSYHNWGYKFAGWITSTGENMKAISYQSNGQPINTDVLSNIQDFNANMTETHLVNNFLVMGNNVGIGTTAPDEKLTVKGRIHTQEVRVDMLGPLVPDYVFGKDYKLKTLEEVETYIKENNHLPEIPSAQEIEKNGLMLAEMNMNLLKKIEELTLYMIEIKKENEVMKKDISKLKLE